ncbi:hypothetical protein PLICRDRAFT_694801 [Plicaturopsis crispa FD-325 SS-3]|nr:hypothetical protein PLICRDRAFT_694801 [Plicaturopsis crispa FD-325 SS-3]
MRFPTAITTCGRLKLARYLAVSAPAKHAQAISVGMKAHAKTRIAKVDADRPFSPALVDSFSRRHDYLRISLTERCNLRCFYCMPSEGVELSPQGKLLTNDEVIRLATLFVKSGVQKIRLTGGEPTVRKDILDIISRLHELRRYGLRSIAMTSNGLSLHRKLPQYIANGLTHLNLSLDTLDPFKFEIMTRRMGHDAVLRTLDAALASSELHLVKLNVVVVKGLNDSEVNDFVDITKDKAISVRFIEFMPFTGNAWDKDKMVPSSELLSRISAKHPFVVRASDENNDTARSWKIPGYRGTFGFISSMSDHFCSSCNRLRITADGQIKAKSSMVCLFDAKEVSLRDEIRRGASDAELLRTISVAVNGKQEKHVGMEDIDVVTNRPMILIGTGRSRRILSSTTRSSLTPKRSRFNVLPHQTNIEVQQRYFASSSVMSEGRSQLTHLDAAGRASMVDVSQKEPTRRTATASGRILIPPVAYRLVTAGSTCDDVDSANADSPSEKAVKKSQAKGNVLTVAQLAGIMGSKRTSDPIPLCHPLALSHISVTLTPEVLNTPVKTSASSELEHCIVCTATVSCEGKTGVEMEALTAVSVGLLTVWDMLKAVAGKEMEIGDVKVTHKTGGRSGDFVRA